MRHFGLRVGTLALTKKGLRLASARRRTSSPVGTLALTKKGLRLDVRVADVGGFRVGTLALTKKGLRRECRCRQEYPTQLERLP